MKQINLQARYNKLDERVEIYDTVDGTVLFKSPAKGMASYTDEQLRAIAGFLCDHAEYTVQENGEVWREVYATTWLTRDDLAFDDVGLTEEQAKGVDDDTMSNIASDMGDAHMSVYWIDLPIIAESYDLIPSEDDDE